MKVVLINPPHTAIGSRVPEFGPMSLERVVEETLRDAPDCVLIGHSGSTSAHPTALAIARLIKARRSGTVLIYGGVFPTYHWRDGLAETDVFDVIVRGEGEATIARDRPVIQADQRLWDYKHQVLAPGG